MSKLYDYYRGSKKDPRSWFLKADDGRVFGPATLETLREWAEQGRIQAGHQVSKNRREWSSAEDIPELAIDWEASVEGRLLGPFNIHATAALVDQNILTRTMRLKHRASGQEMSVAEALASGRSRASESESDTADAEEPPDTDAGADDQVQADTTEPTEGGEDVRKLSEERDRAREQAKALQTDLAAVRKELAGTKKKLTERIGQLETDSRASASKLSAVTHQVSAYRRREKEWQKASGELQALRDELAASQAQLAKARDSDAKREDILAARIRDIDREKAALEGELLAQGQQLEKQSADRQKKEKALLAKVAEYERRTGEQEDDIERLQAELRAHDDKLAEALAHATREQKKHAQRAQRLGERLDALKATNGTQATEIKDLQRALRKAETQIRKISDSSESDKKDFREAKRALREAARQAARKQVGAEKKAASATKQQDVLRKQLKNLKARYTYIKTRAARQEQEFAGRLALLQGNLDSSTDLLEHAQAEIQKRRNEAKAAIEAREKAVASEKKAGDRARHLSERNAILEEAKVQAWRLRRADESEYGPVPLSDLRTWAETCRVWPDDEVSLDGREWQRASDTPELRMSWRVRLVNGVTFGPINLFAVTHLVEDGAVAADCEARHLATGRIVRVDEIPPADAAGIVAENLELRERIADLEKRLGVSATGDTIPRGTVRELPSDTTTEPSTKAPPKPPATIADGKR